jgi:hypothetical protein
MSWFKNQKTAISSRINKEILTRRGKAGLLGEGLLDFRAGATEVIFTSARFLLIIREYN